MKFSIKINNFIYNIFLVFFLLISSSYLGNIYIIIYKIYISLFVINIIHFILTISKLYYYQNFSTEHPKKGDKIQFKLTIENRLPFIPSVIKILFHDSLSSQYLYPKFKRSKNTYYEDTFSLPYRGIYNVGIKKIKCNDIFGIFRYEIPFWPRTFYVYPKINENIKSATKGCGDISNKHYTYSTSSSDFLNGIKKYRNGNKLSLLSWKHLALKGEPYVKDFYSENSSETYIFLDKTKLPENRKGAVDDLLIETLVSITNNLIENNHTIKTNEWQHEIRTQKDFRDFYKSTILIPFDNTQSDTLNEFKSLNDIVQSRLILITAFESVFFMDLDFINAYKDLTIYIITKNMNKKQIENLNKTIEKYIKYADIVCIKE